VILYFVCPSLAVIQVENPLSSIPFNGLVFKPKLSSHKVMFYNMYRQIAPTAFLRADLALPSHHWSPDTVLFYWGCFVFVFQLCWLSEPRG